MVYKYYSPTEYNFEAIDNGYFFFCKVSKLNDPFDTNLNLLRGLSQQYMEYAQKIVDDYGTCSFSRSATNRSLWAMYANSYTGFAVGYDETKFEDLTRQYNFRFLFHDVFYVDNPLDISNPETSFPSFDFDGEEQMIQIKECIGKDSDQKKLDKLFIFMAFMKEAKIWAKEEEFRIFVGKDIKTYGHKKGGIKFEENGYKVEMPNNIIKSIIMGHNIRDENKKRLIKLATTYNVPLYITQVKIPFNIDIIRFYN